MTVAIGPLARSLAACLVCALSIGLAAERTCDAAEGVELGEPDRFWAARDALDKSYAASLNSLAVRCDELKLEAAAQTTRRWQVPRDPRRQYLFLPAESDPARPPADAPLILQQWYERFSALRKQQADSLIELARGELKADEATRAYQLVHEALHECPDHEAARAILGSRRVDGKPEARIRARQENIANADLGFNAGKHWVADSEHFRITTDHSKQAGQELAEQLEVLYDVWDQLFYSFRNSTSVLARRFEGKPPVGRAAITRHKIVLFRNREEYVQRLKQIEPQIEISLGVYWEPHNTAYFFAGPDDAGDSGDSRALYFHEVTHQLFAESARAAPAVAAEANAWIVEGVAMYMESLRTAPGYCTVGGIDADRLQYARYRALNQGTYTPLEQLSALGRKSLQQHADIRQLYSQSAGLTALLMDFDRGRYRRRLTQYLQLVYQGHDSVRTFGALVAPPQDLDAQYRLFLDVTDADLAWLETMPDAQKLSLGRTQVTDAGLKHLRGHRQLKWVDLAYTPVTDAGLACLKSASHLQHLIVEHTQITDAGLETIGGFSELQILDLTGTSITDAGLAHLKSLASLQELWLDGTQVTDACLESLTGLKKLQKLEVSSTGVTPSGLERLQRSLPSLNKPAKEAE